MRTYSFQGVRPRIHPSVYAFDDVVVIGDVEIDADVSLWPGVTVRGDKGPVRIGRGSNVQDHAMLHSDPAYPLVLGTDVTVAHGALLHGCTIGSGTVVGIGAIVLNGVSVGESSRVSAAILNHASGHQGSVAGIYNRSTYRAEKAAALQRWADWLGALMEGKKPASNVVALAG